MTCYTVKYDVGRVVNIAVLVLLPIVSVILFEYWHNRPYSLYAVSILVSVILSHIFFRNI